METIANDFTINIATANGTGSQSANLILLQSMFEMGITTTSGGSGFGLYHAKTIIEKLNGKIYAIPQEPSGMEIRVEVPR